MTTAPERSATLTEIVTRKIRARMGWIDIRQAELAKRLGENDQWLSTRLKGRTPININDLMRIATALGVGLHELLPTPEEAAAAPVPLSTHGYSTVTDHLPLHTYPTRGNRPPGHPSGASRPGISRTAYVDRADRRKRDR